MKKKNVIWIIVAVVIVIVVVSLISWLITRATPLIIQGQVEATSYKASSKIAGRIEEMKVSEGDSVEKGQLLYVLSTPEIDAKLRQAEAVRSAASAQDQLALAGARSEQIEGALNMWQKAEAGLSLARKTFERAKNLYDQGVIPAQKYDEAEANYKAMKATASAAKAQYDMAKAGARKEDKAAAKAMLEQAQSVVSEVEIYQRDACVYAPASGEVSTVIAQEGELVGTGYPVVAILDISDQWVSFYLRETMLPKIHVGTRFQGYVPALDRDVDLEVYYIAVQADFATWTATRTQGSFDVRTFNVKARPVGPVDDLRPGMSVLVNWDTID